MVKKTVLAVLLLVSPVTSLASPCSAIPLGSAALLCQEVWRITLEIHKVTGLLRGGKTSALAEINLEKNKAEVASYAKAALELNSFQSQMEKENAIIGRFSHNGKLFNIGGLAPQACLKEKDDEIAREVLVDAETRATEMKEWVSQNITVDLKENPYSNSYKEALGIASMVLLDVKEPMHLESNPLLVKNSIDLNEFWRQYSFVNYLINPVPPVKNDTSITGDRKKTVYSLRYETLSKTILAALNNHLKHFLVAGESGSEHDLFTRYRAKITDPEMNVALKAKSETGIRRQINLLMADMLAVQVANQRIRDDISRLEVLSLANEVAEDK